MDPLAAAGSTVRDHYGEGHEFGFVHVEFVVPFTMSVFHRDQVIVADRGYLVIGAELSGEGSQLRSVLPRHRAEIKEQGYMSLNYMWLH